MVYIIRINTLMSHDPKYLSSLVLKMFKFVSTVVLYETLISFGLFLFLLLLLISLIIIIIIILLIIFLSRCLIVFISVLQIFSDEEMFIICIICLFLIILLLSCISENRLLPFLWSIFQGILIIFNCKRCTLQELLIVHLLATVAIKYNLATFFLVLNY